MSLTRTPSGSIACRFETRRWRRRANGAWHFAPLWPAMSSKPGGAGSPMSKWAAGPWRRNCGGRAKPCASRWRRTGWLARWEAASESLPLHAGIAPRRSSGASEDLRCRRIGPTCRLITILNTGARWKFCASIRSTPTRVSNPGSAICAPTGSQRRSSGETLRPRRHSRFPQCAALWDLKKIWRSLYNNFSAVRGRHWSRCLRTGKKVDACSIRLPFGSGSWFSAQRTWWLPKTNYAPPLLPPFRSNNASRRF